MKTYKIGDTIKFRIRTDGDPATDNPTATVYDETDVAVVPDLTLGSGLTQIGSKRIVKGSFVPDENGIWSVNIIDDTGLDLVKQFIVGDYSIESIGGLAATLESKVDAQDVVMDDIGAGTAAVNIKVDAQDLVLADILAKASGGGGHFG